MYLYPHSVVSVICHRLSLRYSLCVEVNQHGQFAFDDPVCEVIVVLNIERDFPAGGVRKAAR